MGKSRLTHVVMATIAFGALSFVSASSQHSHVHGEAQAAIIVEGQKVTISLVSTMHDIVGFEHSPHNHDEEVALAKAISALEAGSSLFAFNAKADCRFQVSDISLPEDSDKFENEHSKDLEADFIFQCAKPQRLRTLTFNLTTRFPALEQIDTVVITHNRQRVYQLESARDTIEFNRN